MRQRYREGQEDQLSALGVALNAVVLWNTFYMNRALTQLRAALSRFSASAADDRAREAHRRLSPGDRL